MSDTMTVYEFEQFENATAVDSLTESIASSDSAVRELVDSIMHSVPVVAEPSDPAVPASTIAMISTMAVLIGLPLAYYIYTKIYWDRGIFPPRSMNRRSRRYDAILNLGFNILRCDVTETVEKHRYLRRFLNQKFPEKADEWNDAYQLAQSLPLTTRSLAFWLGKHLPAEEKRELLQVLFTIAVLDGVMGQREFGHLLEYVKHVGLTESELTAMVERQRRERAENLHEEQQRSRPAAAPSHDKRKKAQKMLQLSEGFTQEDLKKAYRSLAKRFHPDKFQHTSAPAQQEAHARFLEIQEAYEFLLES